MSWLTAKAQKVVEKLTHKLAWTIVATVRHEIRLYAKQGEKGFWGNHEQVDALERELNQIVSEALAVK